MRVFFAFYLIWVEGKIAFAVKGAVPWTTAYQQMATLLELVGKKQYIFSHRIAGAHSLTHKHKSS